MWVLFYCKSDKFYLFLFLFLLLLILDDRLATILRRRYQRPLSKDSNKPCQIPREYEQWGKGFDKEGVWLSSSIVSSSLLTLCWRYHMQKSVVAPLTFLFWFCLSSFSTVTLLPVSVPAPPTPPKSEHIPSSPRSNGTRYFASRFLHPSSLPHHPLSSRRSTTPRSTPAEPAWTLALACLARHPCQIPGKWSSRDSVMVRTMRVWEVLWARGRQIPWGAV